MKKTISILLLLCAVCFAQEIFDDPTEDVAEIEMAAEEATFSSTPKSDKTYKTVKIGEQIWMAENLNYGGEDGNIGVCSGNDPNNCDKYGRLYKWEEAMLACPDGWHLPDYDEWQTLMNFAGGKEIAGQKLKAKSGWEKWNCEWTSIDDRGRTKKNSKCNSDNYGFSALPSSSDGQSGFWWTASENYSGSSEFAKDIDKVLKNVAGLQTGGKTENVAGVVAMLYNSENIKQSSDNKSKALSVRCIKGERKKPSNYKVDYSEELGSKTELGGRRGAANGGFNDGYAECGSGGIGDMLGGLMGGSAGCLGTKAGSLKAPSARDIDMGTGDGSRSKAEIMAVINARMPGLRNIYNKYLKLNPGFSGKIILKFTIAPGGDIVSISIVSSTTGYGDFDNAVKNMVATWKWKVIKSGFTTPTVPFNFTE